MFKADVTWMIKVMRNEWISSLSHEWRSAYVLGFEKETSEFSKSYLSPVWVSVGLDFQSKSWLTNVGPDFFKPDIKFLMSGFLIAWNHQKSSWAIPDWISEPIYPHMNKTRFFQMYSHSKYKRNHDLGIPRSRFGLIAVCVFLSHNNLCTKRGNPM